jgi:hypothetical protein
MTLSLSMNNGTGTPAPDLSLASLATASPEDIKRLMASLPPQFLSNVRAALFNDTKVDANVHEVAVMHAAAVIHATEPKKDDPPQPTPTMPTEAPPFPDQPPQVPPQAPPAPPTQSQSAQPGSEFALRPPPHFEVLPPDYPLYDPLRCMGRSILGVPLTSIELPKQTSAGRALVIRLLQPTLVIDGIGRLFEARIGQDILLEVSHWLRALVRRAHDEKHVGEVWLKPGELRKCVGGDVMPDWEIYYGRLFLRDQFMKGG